MAENCPELVNMDSREIIQDLQSKSSSSVNVVPYKSSEKRLSNSNDDRPVPKKSKRTLTTEIPGLIKSDKTPCNVNEDDKFGAIPVENGRRSIKTFSNAKYIKTSRNCSNSVSSDDQDEGFNGCASEEIEECSTASDQYDGIPRKVDRDNQEDEESSISAISSLSEHQWLPSSAGPISWVQKQMAMGANPRIVLQNLLCRDSPIPFNLDDLDLWKIIINLLTECPKRKKLDNVSTLQDVISLLRNSVNILVLTGAGVSVSCGIPDFRSKDGIYSKLAVDYPDLPDPQAMFDIHYFRKNPYPFFKFAKEIYPGQFKPSLSHKFIQLLEQKQKLLRNYTQNIDTLEQVAGISQVVQCHGSFAKATCMFCKRKVSCEDVKPEIMDQKIPLCKMCKSEDAVMKPDIVFFGESLPEEFHKQMEEDRSKCDLLIVIGSSLKVRPVALIPNSLPAKVPQILINREPLKHLNFDVELLGDCDVIVQYLCQLLEWPCESKVNLKEVTEDKLLSPPCELIDEKEAISADSSSKPDELSSPDMSMTTSNGVAAPSQAVEPVLENNVHSASCDLVSSLPEKGSNVEESGPSNESGDWQPRLINIASLLPENSFLSMPSSRYVFPGGEVYDESTDEEDGSMTDDEEKKEDGGCKEDKDKVMDKHNALGKDEEQDRMEGEPNCSEKNERTRNDGSCGTACEVKNQTDVDCSKEQLLSSSNGVSVMEINNSNGEKVPGGEEPQGERC